jgi:alkylhydroperoxidase family enzyme
MTKRDHLANLARRIRRAQVVEAEKPTPATYQASRARREAAAAELAEIALADRAAELMEAAAVRATLAGIADLVRGRAAPMVDRLVADTLAAHGDEAAIAAALTRGIHRELVALADALEGRSGAG